MAIADDTAIDYVNGIISYTGGFTDGVPDSSYTMNEVLSYLAGVFDESAQMDDAIPIDGLTPTNYEILYPWFIDPTSIKAYTGGALESNGWAKFGTEDTSNVGGFGITKLVHGGVPTEGGDLYTDKGVTLTGGTSGATGDILWADNANNTIYVRNTSATQFDDATPEAITGTGWSVTLTSSTGVSSGELLATNLFSLAQIKNDTDIYLIQNDTKLTSWWLDAESDHLDVLVMVRDAGDWIDSGSVRVMARQSNTLYDHFTVDLSVGGRQPAPLATSADINNTTGYKTISTAADHSGPFTIGEVITGGTSGAKGFITSFVDDTSINYILTGKNLTDFQSAEVLTGEDSTETATTNGAPANAGPASSTATLAFGAISRDLNNGNGSRPYHVEIDCNQEAIEEVYEYLKWVTRRGSTTQLGYAGSQKDGEQYLGTALRLKTGTPAPGAFTQGGTLTQTGGAGAGATAIIEAYHSSPEDILILTDVRGTFTTDATNVTDGTNSATIDAGGVNTIAPSKQSPFGTFAGGTFFGATGVYVTDLHGDDIQAYNLLDDLSVQQSPPNEISVAIGGLSAGDRGAVYRRVSSTGPVQKDTYAGTVQSSEATTVVVGTAIASDEPAAGRVAVVDKSEANEPEAVLRYASWDTSTFTLGTGVTGAAEATSSGSSLDDTGIFGSNIYIGDTILNTTTSAWGYVVTVTDSDNIITVSAEGQTLTWSDGDGFKTNVLPYDTLTSDKVWVPLAGPEVATGSQVSNTLIYSSDIDGRFVFRLSGFKPFTSNQTIPSAGLTVAAVRTTDTVVTP